MSTPVERIRAICRTKAIPIHRIEMDLGFSNGYLNPKKTKEIPSDRLAAIAEYLNVPVAVILQKENPVPIYRTGISPQLEAIYNSLSAQGRADLEKYALFLQSQEVGK